MNTAEGATLRNLPFDLRHWRGPIAYKLGREAEESDRLAIAAQLKSDLKERILPGLLSARAAMSKAAKDAERVTALAIVNRTNNGAPISIVQEPDSQDIKSLQEIIRETPTLAREIPERMRPTRGIVEAAGLAAMSSMVSGMRRGVLHLTDEQKEKYDTGVIAYYEAYERYLDEQDTHARLVLRSFQVDLHLENSGNLPATDIDVEIIFPDFIVLYDDDHPLPAEPKAPQPPKMPTIFTFPAIGGQLSPSDVRSYIRPSLFFRAMTVTALERRVTFTAKSLKHQNAIDLDEFVVSFAAPADVRSFDASYRITANEPRDPIEGNLRFDIVTGEQ